MFVGTAGIADGRPTASGGRAGRFDSTSGLIHEESLRVNEHGGSGDEGALPKSTVPMSAE